MIKNRSMPPGVVIPELPYSDVREAVDWLCRSFGFVERLRIGNHRAQLSFGEGSIIVTKQHVTPGTSLPEFSNSPPLSIMVRLSDIDTHYELAKRFGAQIIKTPANYPYGERQYTVEDIGGHRWTFSQTIADINPDAWGAYCC